MKCIEKDGRIKRVTDEEAREAVARGAKYVQKKAWKEQKRGGRGCEVKNV